MSFREHALERQLGVSLTDNWNSSFLPALAGIINCYLNIKNITNTNTFFFLNQQVDTERDYHSSSNFWQTYFNLTQKTIIKQK